MTSYDRHDFTKSIVYSIYDFVGSLGTTQLASVCISNSALTVIFVLSKLVSLGVIALVSRCFGGGKIEEVKKLSGEVYLISLITGVLCSIYFINIKNNSTSIRVY